MIESGHQNSLTKFELEVPMRRNRRLALVPGLILTLTLLPFGWAFAQPGRGGGMMGSQKGGMMHQKQMMSGMGGHGGGMMQGGMQAGMLMQGYHAWVNRLMVHAADVGLSSEQVEKIDQMITAHQVQAVRKQAEIQVVTINLKKDLRAKSIDLKSVEKQLQSLHGEAIQMELEGVRLYTQVLSLLSPQQREEMQQTIGSPFPAPWEKGHGDMKCPPAQEKQKDEGGPEEPPDPSHH
jgi:hypothetical protein